MKVTETKYGNKKQIVKFPDHYVAISVTVDDTGVVAVDGKKIVPAGTIIGGGTLADPSVLVTEANDETAEGVLFNDVDVTYGPAPGAMIIHGFIDLTKLPIAPDATAVTALKQITFIA
ncbi:MAG TPA: hypothetical protein IAA29_00750 [Candidatus Paenibacillus intestinavium]|nr:hypothetical protein [Candidatus Paenibacillus intestinavium]